MNARGGTDRTVSDDAAVDDAVVDDATPDDTVIRTRSDEAAAPPRNDLESDDTVLTLAGGSVTTEPTLPVSPVARVSFYHLRIGQHSDAVSLDVPCYIGRRPSAPRIPSATPPRLVRVPSPLKEVSATHLEVRQVGASVVVRDLASTNGSVVMIPGSVPRKLRQGESVVVSPGTLVDIGEDNIVQVLPLQPSH